MTLVSAENDYKEGLIALVEGRPEVARKLFHAAIRTERQRGAHRPRMRYLSYFGLAVALSEGAGDEALDACRQAVIAEPGDPNLLLNLGKVEVMAGRPREAIAAFRRGLEIDPKHAGLRIALQRTDRRRNQVAASPPPRRSVYVQAPPF